MTKTKKINSLISLTCDILNLYDYYSSLFITRFSLFLCKISLTYLKYILMLGVRHFYHEDTLYI